MQSVRSFVRKTFGFQDFRPGQEAAIKSLLDGHDTLAILPTGLGKSLIYQVAALLLTGPAIVVSPLIALQRNQVDSIEEMNVGDAVFVNSTMRDTEREDVFMKLEQGKINFLFLAPEQFNNANIIAHVKAVHPALFVVDEAHCISEWGHNFRPEYLHLANVLEEIGRPRVLALTATAAPPVREEIIERLDMREPHVIVQGFDRPNIWLGVEHFYGEQDKLAALLERIAAAEKPGIVYAATRKHAELVTEQLLTQNVKAAFYHAGMKASEREAIQAQFMNDTLEVIVATTAFGMGIDKPNVRFVFHYEISDSIDAYYQEIGRAGRDGLPAKAILFYRSQDLGIRRFFAGVGHITVDEVEQVVETIQESKKPLTLHDLSEKTHLSRSNLAEALNRLEDIDVIEMWPSGEIVASDKEYDIDKVGQEVLQTHESRRQYEKSRIEMMCGYAEVQDCRREYLLNYLGEETAGPCGHCDNCDNGIIVHDQIGQEPFPINSHVRHKIWNVGLVLRYEGDKMVVLFDEVGYKTLSIDLVIANHILEPYAS